MTKPTPTPGDIASQIRLAQPQNESRYRRGEIWMVAADLSAPAIGNELWSNRPAVILSNNTLNARSGVAQIVYLTSATRKRSSPTHVELPAFEGKTGATLALCEQIHTVDASRLLRKMSQVKQEHIRQLDAAVAFSLSLGRNPDTYSLFSKWEEQLKVYGIDIAKEIEALAGHTTDQRVESLMRALVLVAGERDAFESLYESQKQRGSVLADVTAAMAAAPSPT